MTATALALAVLAASAAALPDPVTLFETVPGLAAPEGREAAVGIKNVLQDQGVALAEATFDSTLAKSKCMAFELCRYGADQDDSEFAPAVSAFTVSWHQILSTNFFRGI